jgi:AbiV family abortive infection protein
MIVVHRNARSLADDAQILLNDGRYARAYAIAELGAEELGKLLMLGNVAIFTALGESVDWARFWRRFYDHSPKASNISLLDYMYGSKFTEWASGDLEAIKADEAGVDEAARQAAIMAITKNRALYVDWREGKLLSPDASIPKEWAEQMIKAVAELVTRMAENGMPPEKGWLAKQALSSDFRHKAMELRQRLTESGEPL